MNFKYLFGYSGQASENASWDAKASGKRADTLAKIPAEWLLPKEDLDKAANERNLTGPFINQYLSPDDIAIVEQGSVPLVEKMSAGKLSAVQVTRAFCKTAAIAHQIVGISLCTPAQLEGLFS